MATDVEIYEANPHIKEMNDTYVALGTSLKDLESKMLAAHDSLQAAEASQKSAVDAAQAATQKALAAEKVVRAEQTAAVKQAGRVLEQLRAQITETMQKQAAIQADHNSALADAHAVIAAKDEAESHDSTVTE